MNNPVPFLDLNSIHHQLKDEFNAVFAKVLETGRFIGGPMVDDFEQAFAQFCGVKHCIGVSSGTDAVRFALMASGIKEGEIVITVPNTFIATTEAITQAGADIAFIDIDEQTYNMDPQKLREYLEKGCSFNKESQKTVDNRTGKPVTAVLPVHLYGQIADMDPIMEIAHQFSLTVIEDSCQAHGAEYRSGKDGTWKKAGSIGKAAAFSFYPGKNLGAFGEGGAVTTNDDKVAECVRMLRDHGQSKKYIHAVEGYNGRLDAIQAGILSVKLKHLDQWNKQRQTCASRYNELFKDASDIGLPATPEWSKPVFHLYVIRVPNRESLQQYLTQHSIGTGLHYPIPLHLQYAYNSLGYKKGVFPVVEAVASEILSLPMFPGLTEEQQHAVVEKIMEFYTTI